jgi:LPXTG-motif cell wall-anchored protein
MKHTIRNTVAVAALVAASTLALPAAAQATIYPPSNACSVVPSVITPGATVTFNCTDGSFTPGEFVSVTVEGNTSAEVGFVKFAVTSSGDTTASATGSIEVPIAFPSNASGTYNITAVSETSAGGVASAQVAAAGSGAGGSDGLPATGFDSSSLLGLWVGGGALVLAGGAIAVAATVRRNRQHAEV